MIKSALIISATLFGAAAPTVLSNPATTEAEQVIAPLPETEAVVAQFSYLEVSHSAEGFELSLSDTTAVFVDFEFAGDFHVRIGF